MKSSEYTIWGIVWRILLLCWPIYLIADAWYWGDLIKLIIASILLLLILWWTIAYAIKFHKQGKLLEAQRKATIEQAQAEQAERERQQQVAAEKARAEKEERERQRKEAIERQAEWERTHGRLVTKISGVTFRNEDGSSRQKYLKEAYVNQGEGTIEFESYDYQGTPAIRVFYDDMCIGNIPKDKVQDILDVLDRVTSVRLDVERFVPDDEDDERLEPIYRADLTIVYRKNAKE